MRSNDFGWRTFREFARGPGSFAFCPLSLLCSLAAVRSGLPPPDARNVTAALHLPPESPTVDEAVATLLRRYEPGPDAKGVRLRSHTGVWAAADVRFGKPPDAVARLPDGTWRPLPVGRAAGARSIEQWAAGVAGGSGGPLVAARSLAPATRLVLADVARLEGLWARPFEAASVGPGEFTVAPGRIVPADRMQTLDWFRYAEHDGVRMVELPFTGHESALLLFVCSDPRALDGLAASLDDDAVRRWVDSAKRQEVLVTVPVLSMSRGTSLPSVQRALGVPAEVFHALLMDLGPGGTSRTAAGVDIRPVAKPLVPAPFAELRADRPFLFVARHHRSSAVLGVGRISDPRPAP
jgi:serpin B